MPCFKFKEIMYFTLGWRQKTEECVKLGDDDGRIGLPSNQLPLTGFVHLLEGFAKCGVAAADQLPGVLQGSVFLLHLVDFSVQQICLLSELLSLLCGLKKR